MMPIATADKVSALTQDLRSTRRLAELLRVDPSQVSRWRRGQGIDVANAERVDLLEMVLSSLLRMHPAEVAESWLTGSNPNLHDRRPIDLIRAGRAIEVIAALAAERGGSFA